MPPGKNGHQDFEEALQHARERAAANRARAQEQPHAPDPPESGLVGGAPGGGNKDKAGAGSAAVAPYPPLDHSVAAERAAGVGAPTGIERTVDQARRDEAVAAIERAERERNLAALSAYRNIPLHSRLGMGPNSSTAGSLLQQMQLKEMQTRIAVERHYEERVREAQAREYQLAGVSQPPWGHPAMAGLRGAPMSSQGAAAAAARSSQYLDLQAEIAAEERWRTMQGLPPLGPAPGSVLGRSGFHPGSHLGAPRGGIMGSHPGAPSFGAGEESSPALRPHAGEVAEQATLGAPAVASATDATVEHSPVPPPKSSGGNALFDLLATAAEAKEREEREAMSGGPPVETAGNNDADILNSVPKKDSKRKRKNSNEPKNPLGAFVCKFAIF